MVAGAIWEGRTDGGASGARRWARPRGGSGAGGYVQIGRGLRTPRPCCRGVLAAPCEEETREGRGAFGQSMDGSPDHGPSPAAGKEGGGWLEWANGEPSVPLFTKEDKGEEEEEEEGRRPSEEAETTSKEQVVCTRTGISPVRSDLPQFVNTLNSPCTRVLSLFLIENIVYFFDIIK